MGSNNISETHSINPGDNLSVQKKPIYKPNRTESVRKEIICQSRKNQQPIHLEGRTELWITLCQFGRHKTISVQDGSHCVSWGDTKLYQFRMDHTMSVQEWFAFIAVTNGRMYIFKWQGRCHCMFMKQCIMNVAVMVYSMIGMWLRFFLKSDLHYWHCWVRKAKKCMPVSWQQVCFRWSYNRKSCRATSDKHMTWSCNLHHMMPLYCSMMMPLCTWSGCAC